jgi:hypothetical protein
VKPTSPDLSQVRGSDQIPDLGSDHESGVAKIYVIYVTQNPGQRRIVSSHCTIGFKSPVSKWLGKVQASP